MLGGGFLPTRRRTKTALFLSFSGGSPLEIRIIPWCARNSMPREISIRSHWKKKHVPFYPKMDCWFYLTICFIFLLAKSAGEHPQQMPVALQLFAVAAVAASAPPSEMGSIWFLSHDSCMFNIHACGFFRIVSPKTVRWTIRNEYVGLTGSCWWCSSTSMWNKHIYYHRIQPKWGCQKVQLKNHSKKYRQWRTCASSIMSWDVRLLYIYIYLFIYYY